MASIDSKFIMTFYKILEPRNSFVRTPTLLCTVSNRTRIFPGPTDLDILNPVIEFITSGETTKASEPDIYLTPVALLECNWIKIQFTQIGTSGTFPDNAPTPCEKYYFVDDIEITEHDERNRGYDGNTRHYVFKLFLTEDVLYTYKDEILANKAKITRQANKRNGWLVDEKFITTTKPNTQVLELPNGFNRSEASFVLTTLGGV